ncbi:hypothetical protein AWB66_06102 [Caballeronia telluris]|uniref:Uncharacterized protein n=1 Tax=Caballeronia telluris TaxID=326475 RepID=A0A158KF11_9BURK|nr:hypothetical protein AWB66_06102 [Caballeronia telluris]
MSGTCSRQSMPRVRDMRVLWPWRSEANQLAAQFARRLSLHSRVKGFMRCVLGWVGRYIRLSVPDIGWGDQTAGLQLVEDLQPKLGAFATHLHQTTPLIVHGVWCQREQSRSRRERKFAEIDGPVDIIKVDSHEVEVARQGTRYSQQFVEVRGTRSGGRTAFVLAHPYVEGIPLSVVNIAARVFFEAIRNDQDKYCGILRITIENMNLYVGWYSSVGLAKASRRISADQYRCNAALSQSRRNSLITNAAPARRVLQKTLRLCPRRS